MSTNIDAIKAKIRALLAKAESTEHEGEGKLFMAKAMELMEAYQVELYDLHVEDPIGMTEEVIGQSGVPAAKSAVQVALARLYGARPIISPHGNGKWTVTIIGLESSRITTELMTAYVWQQIRDRAKTYSAEHSINIQTATRKVADALVVRVRNILWEREQAGTKAAPGSSFSLAVVDGIQAWMDKNYGPTHATKGRKISVTQTAMDHAKSISLNHQVGSNKQLRLK